MTRRLLRLLLPLLLLAGCAARDAAEDPDAETDAAIAERYERFPPAEPQRCIPARRIRKVDPVGNHSLLFYFQNGDVWRSRLRSRCVAIHRGIVFSYDVRSASLCAGDIVDLLDRVGLGTGLSRVGACALGEFDYLTEEQAEAFSNYQ